MNVLILKKFNNYANRIVVRYETLLDYQKRASSFLTFSDINFNPNDGVITELVVGSETQRQAGVTPGTTALIDWDKEGAPDYLVCSEIPLLQAEVADDSSDSDEPVPTEVIVSRWFITECVRTRSGQFKLTLKRDSIADHLTAVEDAACFIERGDVESIDDPAIYNKESIGTNQIKSDEYLLKDETQCPWIVGYVARNRTETNSSGQMHLVDTSFIEPNIDGPDASDSAASEIYANWDEFWQAHPEFTGTLTTLNHWQATVQLDVYYGKLITHYRTGQTVNYFSNGTVSWNESEYHNDLYLHSVEQDGYYKMNWKWWTDDWRETLSNNFIAGWKTDAWRDSFLHEIESNENVRFVSESVKQAFDNYIGIKRIIKVGNKFYKPINAFANNSNYTNEYHLSVGSSPFNLFYNNLDLTPAGEAQGSHDLIEGTPGPQTFWVQYSFERRALDFEEQYSTCKAKKPANIPYLKDAPYYMFAIPYSNDLALYSGNTLHCVTNKSVAMNAAQAMAQKAGVGVVYDVQLLPYCPIRDIIKTTKISGQAEFPQAEENLRRVVGESGPGTASVLVAGYYFKLNTQYILSKDIIWTHTISQITLNQYGYGLRSDGAIYIKIGTGDLENPTSTYICKKFEIIKPNNDASEDAKIRLWAHKEPAVDETPILELSYNDYVNGNTIIGIYLTSNYDQGGYGENISHTVAWHWTGNTEFPFAELGARQSRPIRWTTGYIYYDDYYMTKIDISKVATSDIVTVVDGVDTDIVNTIFWCTDSQFTFNKYLDNYFLLQADGSYKQDAITNLIDKKVKLPPTITDMKVVNQTDMIRLAAPNYSNFFDINVVQNRGIEFINVDCTYKPFQPYMHLNPNFKGLYGADYNDVRGLICGGDYSIATTTDAWATYQLQNKNYQAIFDRQMQNLETQHGIQVSNSIINATTGTGSGVVTGATSGAMTGGKLGGGYGAAAGAAIGAAGGLLSGLGGAIDVYNTERLTELQRSTMKDIYYMQLDNIKSLPLGLAKTSYLTNNNKLFPFLEFYTCTPTEDMAVRDYLTYNGMTINRFGKIRDFQSNSALPYIKAKLIRINIKDDPHQVNDITHELAMGVYLPEGDSEN